MSREITVWKENSLVSEYPAGRVRTYTYTETWEVPEDFSDEEIDLYEELCVNGQLSVQDAQACVRALRD
jgi:hypothetical protein